MDGTVKIFLKNGSLAAEENYSHGLKEGISKYYYTNGKISDFFVYKNNLLSGRCFSYDSAGAVTKEVEYSNGELIPDDSTK